MSDIKRLFNRYFGANDETESAWRDFSANAHRYNAWWPCADGATGSEADAARIKRVQNSGKLASDYYDCVSSSYEQGWGRNFHYAPMVPGMSIKQSIDDFERLHGEMTGLKPGMTVLDVGCGIGGPARGMAKKFGCKVVGITNSDWHVERGTALSKEAGLMDQVEIAKGDFHHLPFEDNTFDAAYAFEAICYAPDLTVVYSELHRVLKAGAIFGLDEWVMTDQFDTNIHEHRVLRDRIERGNGLAKMPLLADVRNGLRQCGFEVTHDENMELQSKPGPWYYPLLGMLKYVTCMEDFRTTLAMDRRIIVPMTDRYYRLLVKLKVVPPEFLHVFETMKTCTESVARGSQEGVYSSMWVFISTNKK